AKRVRQAVSDIPRFYCSADPWSAFLECRPTMGRALRVGRYRVGRYTRVRSTMDWMTTLFISDLHLDPERPAITELFGRFVDQEARGAEALYILGDLFEAWVGDDDPSDAGAFVADKLRGLRDAGVPVYFMRGNRDFLLGEDYARRAGMTILPDPAVVVLHGVPTLLTH